MNRREFLSVTGATALGLSQARVLEGAGRKALRIGLVADPQYADVDSLNTRFYRKSIGKLEEAVDHFNGLDLHLCVNVGDLIDRQWDSYEKILRPIARCRHRFHHLLGNHDYEVIDDHKKDVPKRIGLKRRYYSIQTGEWCLVMLDTTDVSPYSHARNAPESAAARTELERLEKLRMPQAKSWNGALSETQLKWLDETCRKAARARRRVIVFAHHPVFPPNEHNLWNSEEVLRVVHQHRHVVAWVNGHNHAGAFGVQDGVPFITLKGMVETESTNAFAVAQILADRMVIKGHGREPDRELVFRQS